MVLSLFHIPVYGCSVIGDSTVLYQIQAEDAIFFATHFLACVIFS
jgi:hypothetical protein